MRYIHKTTKNIIDDNDNIVIDLTTMLPLKKLRFNPIPFLLIKTQSKEGAISRNELITQNRTLHVEEVSAWFWIAFRAIPLSFFIILFFKAVSPFAFLIGSAVSILAYFILEKFQKPFLLFLFSIFISAAALLSLRYFNNVYFLQDTMRSACQAYFLIFIANDILTKSRYHFYKILDYTGVFARVER
ncbi:MAG: hypothetical protein J0647_01530 [Campylobacteraceae bacterium]|nr:hypothetical protein [Campylobacteraceae bacterium]